MADYTTWWINEREASYLTTRHTLSYIAILSLCMKSLETFISPSSLPNPSELAYTDLLTVVIPLSTILSEKFFPSYKHILLVIQCEIFFIVSYLEGIRLSHSTQTGVLIASYIVCLAIESTQIRQLWVINILSGKLVGIWLWKSFGLRECGELESMRELACLGISVYLVVLHEECRRKRMYMNHQTIAMKEAARDQVEAILKAVPEGLIVLNGKHNLKFWNESTERMMEANTHGQIIDTLSKLKYTPDRRFYDTEDGSQLLYNDILHYLKNKDKNTVRFGVVEYDGKHLEVIGSNLYRKSRRSVIISIRDCSNLIQLEEAKAELNWKNAVIRSVSHQLRSPTTAIMAFSSQLVESETHLSQQGIENLKMISVCANTLLHLVNDLLDFSQIIAGTFILNKRQFNLKSVLNDCFSLISIQCKKKGIYCKLHIDKDLPEVVYSDPDRLSQVILNLLSNAVKFTLRGEIHMISEYTSTNTLRITIKDTGIGISSHKLTSLFHVLGRLHHKSINRQGFGLGLHISHIFVELLGEQGIKVNSELGKGSSFSFEICVMEDYSSLSDLSHLSCSEHLSDTIELRCSQYQNSLTKIHEKAPRVLIIEDTECILDATKSFLDKSGHGFSKVSTVSEAISSMLELNKLGYEYKIILLDCEIPEFDCYSTTCQIKSMWEEGILSSMPTIIGQTCSLSEVKAKKCIEAGMKDIILKTAAEKDFISKIQYYLNNEDLV